MLGPSYVGRRNTDHAWMETIAMHFHCPHQMGIMLTLQAGDDAADVTWLEVGEHNAAYRSLYASHKQIADIVFQTHGPHIAQPSPERLS